VDRVGWLFATYAERVSYAVDVIKPRGDEGDLENPSVIETGVAQALVIVRADAGGVFG
jgi:hypothetical protein